MPYPRLKDIKRRNLWEAVNGLKPKEVPAPRDSISFQCVWTIFVALAVTTKLSDMWHLRLVSSASGLVWFPSLLRYVNGNFCCCMLYMSVSVQQNLLSPKVLNSSSFCALPSLALSELTSPYHIVIFEKWSCLPTNLTNSTQANPCQPSPIQPNSTQPNRKHLFSFLSLHFFPMSAKFLTHKIWRA